MGLSRRLAALVTGAAFVAGSAFIATPGIAAAEADQGHGYTIHPAQPTQNNPDSYEWVGSYVVDSKQVWCVDYMYKAPDSDEKYQPGDTLETKWGNPLPADEASQISYMLLRYGDTTDNDEAAALAYWMHAWTAPITDADGDDHPTTGVDDHKKLAYDADFHKANLPSGAQQAIDDMLADAQANHGPWTGKVAAPEQEQTIGEQGTWTIQVHNASGKGLADVPVTVTATGATLAKPDQSEQSNDSDQNVEQAADESGKQDSKAGATVTTGEDGTATVLVTPTKEAPKVSASFASPNETPTVKKPLDESTQKIVLTGGEKKVTASTAGSAKPKPSPTPSTTTVTVPVHIPAGGSAANVQATADTTTRARPGMLIGLGALLLAGAGGVSLVVARRLRHRSR